MSQSTDQGIGRSGFVEQHGLHTAEQRDAAERMVATIRELDLRTIRIAIVDQHGVPRGKFLSADAAIAGLSNGIDFSGAIYSLDSGNTVFPPAFAEGGGFGIPEFTGFPDITVVPDPTTFKVLPWADRTGWLMCDAYFSSGAPLPLDGEYDHSMEAGISVHKRRPVRSHHSTHSPSSCCASMNSCIALIGPPRSGSAIPSRTPGPGAGSRSGSADCWASPGSAAAPGKSRCGARRYGPCP